MTVVKLLLLLSCILLLVTKTGRNLLLKIIRKFPRAIGYIIIGLLILYLIYIIIVLILASLWKLFLILTIGVVILVLLSDLKRYLYTK